MQVHARAREISAPLRHEGDRDPLGECHLFRRLLVDHVAVRHVEGFGVDDVELVLAGTPFALARLDRNAARLEMPAERRVVGLLLGALQHVVVLDVPAEGFEVLEALGLRRVVGLLEDVVLELGGAHGGVPELLQALDLALENAARRDLDRLVVALGEQVADHQRRALEPRGDAQRREVRHAMEVAVALLPVGEGVAGDDVHLHVDGEQIVAGVHPLLGDAVEKEAPGDAFAEQPAVEVRKDHQDGLDLAVDHLARELLDRQQTLYQILRHGVPSRLRFNP